MTQISYQYRPNVSDASLNELFFSSWQHHEERKFSGVLERSLTYICAFDGSLLIGFVNVAWDGGTHGFILDTTVRRDYQRRGIGTELLRLAAKEAAKHGVEWLHCDFEPQWEKFYRNCGYRRTEGGILNLLNTENHASSLL